MIIMVHTRHGIANTSEGTLWAWRWRWEPSGGGGGNQAVLVIRPAKEPEFLGDPLR